MLDAENNYDRASALKVARELEALGFAWLEAPLPDHDLDGYRELTRATTIPVLPSGNWLMDLSAFRHAVTSGAWGTARTDVHMMGGLTAAREAMALTAEAGIRCEVMSWGFSLAAAANLHLILAHENCTFFEHSMPREPYEYGMVDVIRPDERGRVRAPDKPGLGLDVDWERMDAGTFHRVVIE